jgi:hypothetical protein
MQAVLAGCSQSSPRLCGDHGRLVAAVTVGERQSERCCLVNARRSLNTWVIFAAYRRGRSVAGSLWR